MEIQFNNPTPEVEDPSQDKRKYIPMDDYGKNDWEPFGPRKEHFCRSCKLFYAKINKMGLTENMFPPTCFGDISKSIPTQEEVGLDDVSYELAKTTMDPLSWAAYYFNWEPRWYQREMLLCSSQLKVVRAGRRVGKTAAIALAGLHYACNNKFKTVLVIAPFQAQVKKIFDEMKKFIIESPEIKKSIKREVNSPPLLIEFHNNSKVIGFASGKSSGANSDQVRGQDANVILLDEVDFQNDYELETIMAIMATEENCQIYASSTPKGWRRKFYQMCTEKDLGYKEFHYISSESPKWKPKTEKLLRATTSENGYKHEYLAEFGEEETGVYRQDLVDCSLQKYDMSRQRPNNNKKYVMGVDWNAHAGCHIVIVEWTGFHYKLVNKTVVPKSEFTQISAVQRIIQLDQIWKCDHIYVDEGFGTVQIEHLKLTGLRNPSTGLADKVKGIQMGRNVVINDPITGMDIKKGTKQFMVELSVHQMEEGRIILPDDEDTEVTIEPDNPTQSNIGLVQQIRGYTVVRMSATGQPIYSQECDHTLVAWQLAILAFMMEFGGLTRTEYATRVEVHEGQLGETTDKPKYSRTGSKRSLSHTKPIARTGTASRMIERRGYDTVRRNIEQRQRAHKRARRGEFGGTTRHIGRRVF